MKKVALVTGASKGIGATIAKQLANDGYSVAILSRHLDTVQKIADEIKQVGGDALAIAGDVANRDDLFNAVDHTAEYFGDFNTIVNNAGIGSFGSVMDITPAEIDRVMNINLGGTIWGIQAAAQKLKELGHGGKIINASSVAGQEGFEGMGLYSASKFGVKGITQTAAKELAADNITVNAYCPGIVVTELWKPLRDSVDSESAGNPLEQAMNGIALKRFGKTEDIANLVSFLADEKSNFITGQAINVDGGTIFN
ncbi:glucose 1-dehydrogenase [Lactobacillaceae bacterium Melli_B4]